MNKKYKSNARKTGMDRIETKAARTTMHTDSQLFRELFREGNISLILDSYDDLFSDFDPRPYAEKALSDDFLIECKKASLDKSNDNALELRLLLPETKRNLAQEEVIKKRLSNHFDKHYKLKQNDQKQKRNLGFIWLAVGTLLLFFSALVYLQDGVFFQLMFVLMDPAGWFTAWTGLDLIFSHFKEKQPDLEFYAKMTKINVHFYSY